MADSGLIGSGRRHILDLRRLEQFISVVDLGSLTDAAAELGLTQQALSVSIRSLEKQLDVVLFVRTRGMQASPAGLRLYECAQELLATASRTVKDVQAAGQGRDRTLSVGYSPAMNAMQVYDVLGDALPVGTRLQIEPLVPTSIRPRVLAGDIELALCPGGAPPEGLTGKVVAFHRLNVAVRTNDVPPLSGEGIGLEELADQPLIHCGTEAEAADLVLLTTRCHHLDFVPDVEEIPFSGLPPAASPVTVGRGFSLVTDDPGTYFGGRVTVLRLREEILAPVQAVWLPQPSTGAVGALIEALPSPAALDIGTAHTIRVAIPG